MAVTKRGCIQSAAIDSAGAEGREFGIGIGIDIAFFRSATGIASGTAAGDDPGKDRRDRQGGERGQLG